MSTAGLRERAAAVLSVLLILVIMYLGFTGGPLWAPVVVATLGTGLYVAGHWSAMAAPFERKGVPRVLLVIFALQVATAYITYGAARGAGVLLG